jgi:hypothetical protein
MAGKREIQKSRYSLKNPTKYVGKYPHNIIARSSWERKLMVRFDTDPNVIAWSSESIIVWYECPVTGRRRRYFPDFFAKVRQSDGTIRDLLIEVKPKKQTLPPVPPKRKTRRHLKEIATFAINQEKWRAAQAYAAAKGMNFIVMTEDHLGVREPRT